MVMRDVENVLWMEDWKVGRRRDGRCVWMEEDGSNAWASQCMPGLVVAGGEQVLVRSRTIAADISMMLPLGWFRMFRRWLRLLLLRFLRLGCPFEFTRPGCSVGVTLLEQEPSSTRLRPIVFIMASYDFVCSGLPFVVILYDIYLKGREQVQKCAIVLNLM